MPDKLYWRGEDVDQLPRERLIEIIHALNRDLERSRETTKSVVEVYETARAARRQS